MSRQHSFLVDEVNATKNPRAVVLLLGWWGARTRHLDKYAQVLRDLDCITVQAIADKYAVLTHHNASLDDCARQAAGLVAEMLRALDDPEVPVVLYAFSNGGAFLVERMELLIQQAQASPEEEDTNKDLLLVGQHLKGEIFDSGPAFPSIESANKAMAGVFTNTFLRTVIYVILILHALFQRLCNTLLRRQEGRLEFWKRMTHSRLCTKQAFIYSSMDDITDVTKLEELIRVRKKSIDDVLVQKFDDSLHVQHMRKHPEEYMQVLDTFLRNIES